MLEFETLHITNFKCFSGTHTFQLNRKAGLYLIRGVNTVNPELGANGVGKSTILDALKWVLWGKTVRDSRPADSVVPWSHSARIEVGLELKQNGISHSVVRTRKPNSLKIDLQEVDQSAVEALLGLGEEIFCRSILVGQFGELFLDLSSEQQSRLFNESLQLDRWLSASQTASKDATTLETNISNLRTAIPIKEQQVTELRSQLEDCRKQSKKYEIEREEKITILKARLEDLYSQLKNLTPPEKPKIDQKSLDRTAKELNDNMRRVSKECEKLKDQATLVLIDSKAAENDRKALVQELKKYQNAGKKCPECGQPVKISFDDKIKSITTKIANIDSEVKDLRESLARLEAETKKASAEAEHYKAKIEQFNDDNFDCRQALADYDRSDDEYRRTKSNLQQQIEFATDDLDGIGSAVNLFDSQIIKLEKTLKDKQAEIVKDYESKQSLESKAAIAKFWVDGFKEIRLNEIDSALAELGIVVEREAEMFGLVGWGVKFDTERETTSGKISRGFTVSLSPPGGEGSIKWESYCGGEVQRWQLAATLGLAEVLLSRAGVQSNVLLLDEPTQHLSEAGIESLLDRLSGLAHEYGKTIYLVDHRSLDKGSFDGSITVEKTVGGSRLIS